MVRPTVTERLRAVLAEQFQSREFSKSGLARAVGRNPSWVSMLLAGRRTIRLDELDATARYFGMSIGELLGAVRPGEPSGDEQRLLESFRALAPGIREHFLALVEAAGGEAAAARETDDDGRLARSTPGVLQAASRMDEATVALAELRTAISRVSEQLGLDQPTLKRSPKASVTYQRRRPSRNPAP